MFAAAVLNILFLEIRERLIFIFIYFNIMDNLQQGILTFFCCPFSPGGIDFTMKEGRVVSLLLVFHIISRDIFLSKLTFSGKLVRDHNGIQK